MGQLVDEARWTYCELVLLDGGGRAIDGFTFKGYLLRGAAAALMQWPAARRLETVDYPEEDGVEVRFGGGLHDGAPRELRVPLYLSNVAGGQYHYRSVDALEAGARYRLRAPHLFYEADVVVEGVLPAGATAAGSWGTVRLLEARGPWEGCYRVDASDELVRGKQAAAMANAGALAGCGQVRAEGGVAITGLESVAFDELNVLAYRGALRGGERARKKLAGGRRAVESRVGLAEAKVALPCVMLCGLRDAERARRLMQRYWLAWRYFAGRTAATAVTVDMGGVRGEERFLARYVSQRVEAFDYARGMVRFEVTLAEMR